MTDADRLIIETPDQVPETFAEVYAYWTAKRGGDWAPTLRDFHLDELPSEILPWSVVVDVRTDPLDFHYRFWGTGRVRLIGAEMTGKLASEIADGYMRDANMREYRDLIEIRRPLLCQTPVTTASGNTATFQSLRLPFRGDDGGGDVAHVYSAINHADMSEEHYDYYGTRPAGSGP
ncbi:MAG: PAS domain-containing protein [Magnetovibrio sp.]|nr:PAS domain-containing protein [Magnetovibrio sp.]